MVANDPKHRGVAFAALRAQHVALEKRRLGASGLPSLLGAPPRHLRSPPKGEQKPPPSVPGAFDEGLTQDDTLVARTEVLGAVTTQSSQRRSSWGERRWYDRDMDIDLRMAQMHQLRMREEGMQRSGHAAPAEEDRTPSSSDHSSRYAEEEQESAARTVLL
eukprot:g1361.t1